LATAALLDGWATAFEHLGSPPVPQSFIEDFLAVLGVAVIRIGARRQEDLGESIDRTRLDNLTLGLAKFAGRQPAPLACGDRALGDAAQANAADS